jgi:sugar/nucleoside kinase (ribokinase family)
VLKNLAKLGVTFPLAAAGLVGNDPGARWIIEDCEKHGIDTARLRQSTQHATSYTDAFTVQSTGRRTFFHQPGANAHLREEDVELSGSSARLFYLGYLMLLERLDALDEIGRTEASHVLESALQAGFTTIADLVSKQHKDFATSAKASLPFVDYLILNEIESGRLVDRDLRPGGELDPAATAEAGRKLLDAGVRAWVIIHAVEGTVAVSKAGDTVHQASVALPDGFSQGATGAGDAFAAGLIHGLHEGQPMADCLQAAVCVAASCLRHPSTSEGVLPLASCLELGRTYGFRKFA